MDYELEDFDRKSVDDYVATLLELAVLALQTDSTRAVTVQIPFWEGKASLSGNTTTFPTTAKRRRKSTNCSCMSMPSSSASTIPSTR